MATSFDAHKNFAGTTVATAPTPATSGTTLVVVDGTVFPVTPFNASVYATGVTPSPSNAEIVRVTNVSTNSLTIVRQQEGSTARGILVGDTIVAAISVKTATDIQTAVNTAENTISRYLTNGQVTLTDGASVALDASQGFFFLLSASGNRTILTPSNAVDGQKIIIAHFAAGGSNRTLSLTTGSTGAFRFGSDITTLTQTTSAKRDYIGCIYNATDSRWDVIAYTKGF